MTSLNAVYSVKSLCVGNLDGRREGGGAKKKVRNSERGNGKRAIERTTSDLLRITPCYEVLKGLLICNFSFKARKLYANVSLPQVDRFRQFVLFKLHLMRVND